MNSNQKVRISLIFTLDYEIHGNGNGDFASWAYLPTSQMLDIFDVYGAKLTIMAEMGHYWAMKNHKDLFTKEIDLFESQLKKAIERGHDVQLHFHPQWIDAELIDGKWNLEFSKKNIERICYDYDEAYFYLKKGKEDLEKLLRPINPAYQCIGFRAGYFQMQPSTNIIRALLDAGFISDTSVSKGIKANNALRNLDYTSAYSRFKPWAVSSTEICNFDAQGKLFEFPIISDHNWLWSVLINKFKKKEISTVLGRFLSQSNNTDTNKKNRSILELLKKIKWKYWSYADFCLTDYRIIMKYLNALRNEYRKVNISENIPIVLIGHSKDFFLSNNLNQLLELCSKKDNISFQTYAEAIKDKANKDK